MLQRRVSRLCQTLKPHYCSILPCQKKFPGSTTAPHYHANNKFPGLTTAPCCKGVFHAFPTLTSPTTVAIPIKSSQAQPLHHTAMLTIKPKASPLCHAANAPCFQQKFLGPTTAPQHHANITLPSPITVPCFKGVFPALPKAQIKALHHTTKACFPPVQISRPHCCTMLQRRVSRLAQSPASHCQGVFHACSNLQARPLHHIAKGCFPPCSRPK